MNWSDTVQYLFDNPIIGWLNVVAIFVIVFVFFWFLGRAIRAYILWYFRLDEMADNLNQMTDDLHVIANAYRRQLAQAHLKPEYQSPVTSHQSPARHAPGSSATRPASVP